MMVRTQNVSNLSETPALSALLAARISQQGSVARREPEVPPFTKDELRQMILEIMG